MESTNNTLRNRNEKLKNKNVRYTKWGTSSFVSIAEPSHYCRNIWRINLRVGPLFGRFPSTSMFGLVLVNEVS